VISVVGDFVTNDMKAANQNAASGWQSHCVAVNRLQPPKVPEKNKVLL
jgi:hypothetical protein